jgi:hypothetical protein
MFADEKLLREKVAALDWIAATEMKEHTNSCPASDDTGYGPCTCGYSDSYRAVAYIRKCVMGSGE